jgi:hypothetical protein
VKKIAQNVAQPVFQNWRITRIVEKSSQRIWPTSEILNKLPKINNCPIGENSPNLVTLLSLQSRS